MGTADSAERHRATPPAVLLCAASGPDVGMGHVVRSLAVAHALAELGVAARLEVEDARSRELARSQGVDAVLAGEAEGGGLAPTAAWLDGFRDWSERVRALQAAGARVALVENRTPAREQADWLVYPALHWEPDAWDAAHPERVRGGPEWVPLTPAVLATAPAAERSIDLLVSFGGSDPNRLTERALDALAELDYRGRACALVGWHMEERLHDLERRAARLPSVELVQGGAPLAPRIAASRAALTALGTTLYELAYLGVPALILANYAADAAALDHYRRRGPHLALGVADELDGPELARRLADGLAELARRPAARMEVLGGGARRVAELLASAAARA